MQEAAFRTRSWGDSAETVRAGAELLSRSSKLDYYALLAGQSRGPGVSRSEFISSLPLPESDKSELRRIAEAEATGGTASPLRVLGEKVVPIR
jgi:hypothetical protein